MKELVKISRKYYGYLDWKARHLAIQLTKGKPITKSLLGYVGELYEGARIQDHYAKDNFEAAYHNPITSDFEFLLARTLWRYGKLKKLNWTVYLRRQFGKATPDIRIAKGIKTIAVFEVKAKVGWAQSAFSRKRFRIDRKRFKAGEGGDPRETVKALKGQITKYWRSFKVSKNRVFLVVPSLHEVHRKKFINNTYETYVADFCHVTGLPERNFLILSENLDLNLSHLTAKRDLQSTDFLEDAIKRISGKH